MNGETVEVDKTAAARALGLFKVYRGMEGQHWYSADQHALEALEAALEGSQ